MWGHRTGCGGVNKRLLNVQQGTENPAFHESEVFLVAFAMLCRGTSPQPLFLMHPTGSCCRAQHQAT